jgi:hypothetical protein
MANENQILTFKLVIDGKEATATVQIAKKDFEDLNASINKIQDRPILKQFAKDLLLVNASAEEATTGIMDFIRYNEMTEPEIQSVINTLREEQRVLSVGSAQWRTHGQAIENLSNAYQRTIAQQRAFTGASNSARMAVGQFGFALGDASMIAVDFRMFLMSIGNNIPFIVQGLAQVSQEAKTANMSMGAFLKNSMDASMKMVLSANALMFALTVLPTIFEKINEKSKTAAEDGLKKFNDQLKSMTKLSIDQMINERSDELSKIQLKGQLPAFTIGEGSTRVTTNNKLTEDEINRANQLTKELEMLYKRKSVLGDEVDLGLKINVNEEKRRSLTADNYKEIVQQATSLEDARRILSEWIESDSKTLDRLSGKGKDDKKFAETFDKQQEHEINMLKLTTNHNLIILSKEKQLLEEKKSFYLKYGQDVTEINYAIAEKELEIKKHIREEEEKLLSENLKPRGLEINGVNGLIKPPDKKDFEKYYKDLEDQKKDWADKYAKIDSTYREGAKENYEQKMFDEVNAYEEAYTQELISKEQFEKAKDLIEEYYARKIRERDKKILMEKISTYSQITSAWQNSLNTAYEAFSINASREIAGWRDKEDKKLEAEREAALKHARTQAQREKINEQFDRKQAQLEDAANKRAAEKLGIWFTLKQAGDIANTTMSTYSAATSALKEPPVGLGPIFGWPLMAAVIAGGLANVAVISQQKLPGYKKGGAVVGEEGPEIIAPFQDYASGQSKLITMTMMTLRDELRSSRGSSSGSLGLTADYGDIKAALNKLNKHLDDGISARAFLDDKQAKKINARGKYLNNKSRL